MDGRACSSSRATACASAISYHAHMDVDLEGPAKFYQIATGSAQFDAAVAAQLPFGKAPTGHDDDPVPLRHDVRRRVRRSRRTSRSRWTATTRRGRSSTRPSSASTGCRTRSSRTSWENTWAVRAGALYKYSRGWLARGIHLRPDAAARLRRLAVPAGQQPHGRDDRRRLPRLRGRRAQRLVALPVVPRAHGHDEQGQLQRHLQDVRDPPERRHEDHLLREPRKNMKTPHTLLRLLSAAALAAARRRCPPPPRSTSPGSRGSATPRAPASPRTASRSASRSTRPAPSSRARTASPTSSSRSSTTRAWAAAWSSRRSRPPSARSPRRARRRTSRSRGRTTTSRSRGCAIHDMLYATTGAEQRARAAALIDLVLRNSALHIGSQVDQAIALNPTFVFLENVGNDYLGAVTSGTVIDGVTVTPLASFTADTNAAAREAQGQAAERPRDSASWTSRASRSRRRSRRSSRAAASSFSTGDGRADPAPRAEGLPDGRPRLPDPADHARDAERGGLPAVRLRHPVRGRADAPELQQARCPRPATRRRQHPGALIYADDVALLK